MKTKRSEDKCATSQFDANAMRELLIGESKFISQMFDNLKLPLEMDDDEDFLLQTNTVPEEELPFPKNKETSRAKSLEELHEKLQALKGKKSNYVDKLKKKSLKNKISKKEKRNKHKINKTIIKEKKYEPETDAKTKPQKPIYNSEGEMVFSKFDFSVSGNTTKDTNKKLPKDPKTILKMMEKENEKMENLESEGNIEKIMEIKEKKAWNKALHKVEGEVVKDDPELLKKAIQKETQRKKKSKKKWGSRIRMEKKQQHERQTKRQENIEARKKEKKLKLMKRLAKRGRIIPGF